MFFDTIDDLKRSDIIYNDFWNEYMAIGEVLMADTAFLISIIRRAVELNKAFITLTDCGNYIAAAPLLRLQLDNMLYCYAGTIKANNNDFLVGFMDGSNWKNIEDKDGNKLSDDYLLDLICRKFDTDEFKRIYKESSNFIHLSISHLYLSTFMADKKIHFRLANYGNEEYIDGIKHIMLLINYGLLHILITDWMELRKEDMDSLEWLKQQNPTKTIDELIHENSLDDKGFRNLFFSQIRNRK